MTHDACNHEIKRLENELARLRAVNAELVEALEKLARLGNGSEYGNSDGNMIARAALSRAEQTKMETEKCVWRGDLLHGYQVQCGYRPVFGDGVSTGKCLGCGKRIEVKK